MSPERKTKLPVTKEHLVLFEYIRDWSEVANSSPKQVDMLGYLNRRLNELSPQSRSLNITVISSMLTVLLREKLIEEQFNRGPNSYYSTGDSEKIAETLRDQLGNSNDKRAI